MPEPAPNPVIAVALNRPGGDVAVRRAIETGVPVVAIAERGTPLPGSLTERIDVPLNHARVGRAVREAGRRGLTWVVVPRMMGTAEYLLSAALRTVGTSVDAEHPGIALLVVNEVATGTALPVYGRALSVVDPDGPGESGLHALAVVKLACTTGLGIDVLVLGVDEEGTPTSMDDGLRLFPLRRRSEMLREALDLAAAQGVDIRWIPGGPGTPIEAVDRVLASSQYAVVSDSLGGHHLRKRIGKGHDIRRLLDDPAGGAVLRHVIAERRSDVLVVIDAISLGMVPAAAARAGAAAALALGAVGIATPASATSVAAPAAAAVVAPVEASDTAQDEKKRAPAGPITSTDVQQAHQRAREAATHAEQAEQEAHETQRLAQTAAEHADAASAALAEAEERAEPASEQLAHALLHLSASERARLEALDDLAAAERWHNPITNVVTVGRTGQSVHAASEAELQARLEAAAAREAADRAYMDYVLYADEVEKAGERHETARTAAVRAAQQAAETSEQAQRAVQEAQKARQAAKDLEQAYVDQGLHPPATGRITSPFGYRTNPVTGASELHKGVDFSGDDGNYYAAADGTVTVAGYMGSYGYVVMVDHGMVNGHRVETRYAHQPGLMVSEGQQVERGQVIGRIGSTGYSTGPHAHVELRVDGNPIDPVPFITG